MLTTIFLLISRHPLPAARPAQPGEQVEIQVLYQVQIVALRKDKCSGEDNSIQKSRPVKTGRLNTIKLVLFFHKFFLAYQFAIYGTNF